MSLSWFRKIRRYTKSPAPAPAAEEGSQDLPRVDGGLVDLEGCRIGEVRVVADDLRNGEVVVEPAERKDETARP
jgi:hypothetical protein